MVVPYITCIKHLNLQWKLIKPTNKHNNYMGCRYSSISKEVTSISIQYCLANCKHILSKDHFHFLFSAVLALSVLTITYYMELAASSCSLAGTLTINTGSTISSITNSYNLGSFSTSKCSKTTKEKEREGREITLHLHP